MVAALVAVMALPPIAQDPSYHDFADRRTFFGIPSFLNVVTNLAFLAVGIAGIGRCANGRGAMGARWSWMACFIGTALVGLGSGYYHLAPDNGALVWDRVPMSIGFMGLLVAVLAEHLNLRLEKYYWCRQFSSASPAWWSGMSPTICGCMPGCSSCRCS